MKTNILENKTGRYGIFGGEYIPEILHAPLQELLQTWYKCWSQSAFKDKFYAELKNYAGRPTPLTEIPRFADAVGLKHVYLKREDLLHTGAHKINNAIGQCLLAQIMGKKRIIAETGAGQHGVATATACARLGLDCVVYMGVRDMERQAPNVLRMKLLGAEVKGVTAGSQTLKEAVNEAMRDWSASYTESYYCLGSALGPHPYPMMVANFQSVIGTEAREQSLHLLGGLPDYIIACVGGGSNAIGIFSAFLDDNVKLIGIEAGGKGIHLGEHAARLLAQTKGILHGSYSYVLQNAHGQIAETHSISAGLDYPAIGPQHAYLFASNRAKYVPVGDQQALKALNLLARSEGIIAALESAHALAYIVENAGLFSPDDKIIINLSGRGDKDLATIGAANATNK